VSRAKTLHHAPVLTAPAPDGWHYLVTRSLQLDKPGTLGARCSVQLTRKAPTADWVVNPVVFNNKQAAYFISPAAGDVVNRLAMFYQTLNVWLFRAHPTTTGLLLFLGRRPRKAPQGIPLALLAMRDPWDPRPRVNHDHVRDLLRLAAVQNPTPDA